MPMVRAVRLACLAALTACTTPFEPTGSVPMPQPALAVLAEQRIEQCANQPHAIGLDALTWRQVPNVQSFPTTYGPAAGLTSQRVITIAGAWLAAPDDILPILAHELLHAYYLPHDADHTDPLWQRCEHAICEPATLWSTTTRRCVVA